MAKTKPAVRPKFRGQSVWNADALRFYERMGGRYDIKARFSLSL